MTRLDALVRVPTGVPGLDTLMEGGFVEGSVYLIDGPPGAGKTIFAAQTSFACAARGEHAVFVTLLGESHERLAMHLSRMEFFDPSAVPDRVYLVSAFRPLEQDGLDAVLAVVRKESSARRARVVVMDGFSSAEESASSGADVRKFVHALQAMAASTGCTVLLLNSVERVRSFRPERTMVDGIIELSDDMIGFRPTRRIRIAKMRGTDAVRGQHTVDITGRGLAVHQRFETRTAKQHPVEVHAVPAGRARHQFGVPGLDAMMHGGIPARSTTMILGPTGSGKTILGLQMLAAGAAVGEPGLYFGFYEQPDDLALKARRIGIDAAGMHARGAMTLEWHRAAEASIDIVGERLMESLERTKARRLYLDGMQAFQRAIDAPERIGDVIATMVEDLHRRGVLLTYSVETPQLVGHDIAIPLDSASQITHNIVVLRHLEVGARSHRLVSVLKMRDSTFDDAQHEVAITNDGFQVAATCESAERVLAEDERRRRPR